MSIFNKIFGFRWSLYIVRDEDKTAYAMHENSVIRILGYIAGSFEGGANPVKPWSLVLNFNHSNKTIKLTSSHFTDEGDLSYSLIREIEKIDPNYRVRDGEPVFEEAGTRKRLKISDYQSGEIGIQSMIDNFDKPQEVTFFSIIKMVFGKDV